MANQPSVPAEGIPDDFLDQLFSMPSSYDAASGGLGSGSGLASLAAAGAEGIGGPFPLGLSLEQQCGTSFPEKWPREDTDSPAAVPERNPAHFSGLFPLAFGQIQSHQVRPSPPPPVFLGQIKQGVVVSAQQPSGPRPKVRARRGQATDPHSIAERLRRERIAERLRALQELVPNTNKMDRAAMLDEILDYVKFLRLQVKVLSMSRLGGAGAVAQLVADIPLSFEGETSDAGSKEHVWEKWSNDGTERQIAKLIEEDVGAAMQSLQSKALCMMPISLAMAIYDTKHIQPDSESVKPGSSNLYTRTTD